MCVTAEVLKASICVHLKTAEGVPRLLVLFPLPLLLLLPVLLSHDVSTFVPDFVPLFSPGLEGS